MTESFAHYLAKRLIGDKRFQEGVPVEAAPLADQSDIALSHGDYALAIALIVDRTSEPKKRFSFEQQALIDIGKQCLKYTGTINGAKMPVGISLYEVGDGPLGDEDRERLESMQRTIPGLTKVAIVTYYLDVRNKTVWGGPALAKLFRIGNYGWLLRVLAGPRKKDEEIFVPDAVLPARERKPIATAVLLAALIAMFVLEHVLGGGGKASGLLGVDLATLYALGGMNSQAVLQSGEWQRLFGAALLHADIFHLALNGVALGLAGWFLEAMLGRAWFLVLFWVGALGGSLMGLLVNPSNMVSVGASGAVMGLLAAALVAALRFPPGAARMQIQLPLLQFLIPSLIPLATNRHGGRIDFAAHIGGAIVGAIAGAILLKLWPKTAEHPRYPRAATGLALLTLGCFAASLVLVYGNYAAHAAEASIATEGLLVDDARIPQDIAQAKKDVEEWGKDHPRDPRVHFFRALRLFDEGNEKAGEGELRAALAERKILDGAFGDKKLETGIRSVLCELLLHQGRQDEARRTAEPMCKAAGGSAPAQLTQLGLCQ